MTYYHTNGLFIFFGSKDSSFDPNVYRGYSSNELSSQVPFNHLAPFAPLQQLLFLQQVHSADGLYIARDTPCHSAFTVPGDFLITQRCAVALGVVTADCLPIIIYHHSPRLVAVIHAGWRGSVGQIVVRALREMGRVVTLNYDQLTVFFGPSAGACCYTVGDAVRVAVQNYWFHDAVLTKSGEEWFFNIPLFNQLLLQEEGIAATAFVSTYHECTLCNEQYCSYRRESSTMRQMTVVVLQELFTG
jgi:polyphenol oxidase